MHDYADLLAEFERLHVHPAAGRTLIVGSKIFSEREDRRLRYPQVLGVDIQAGDGVDRVLDLEEPLPDDIGRFHHIECMSVLEHSKRPWKMAANIERLLKKGGTLFLTVPFVWRFHAFPNDYFRYTAEGVRSLFPGIRWTKLAYVSNKVRDDHYLRAETIDDHPYMPRTEVVGFGVRP